MPLYSILLLLFYIVNLFYLQWAEIKKSKQREVSACQVEKEDPVKGGQEEAGGRVDLRHEAVCDCRGRPLHALCYNKIFKLH